MSTLRWQDIDFQNNALAALLRPNGSLFLGSAETTLNISSLFEPVREGSAVYYRRK